ncbi:hypothetical protein H072_4600 [Dactylellina haptotyla CBS 200.50]|uniref:F-box domain-containing protein n=1 Tax=Dactylellina haptotyla (strain CBS 200.50) TaxID=1284197 RepID=S8BPT9_DACHA|nr:hypothetical protein H072_4600 [Dactylellina haptotyla CBS 200.50]
MANITALPFELLFDIFHRLDQHDLARCKRTCKSFNETAQQIPLPSLTLKLHLNQHAWKFARYLLFKPEACDQLKELRVKWGVNTLSSSSYNISVRRWIWSKREIRRFRQLSDSPESPASRLTPDTFKTIVLGIDAEALVPFILCFAKNLEYLKLGDFETYFWERHSLEDDSKLPRRSKVLSYFLRHADHGGSDISVLEDFNDVTTRYEDSEYSDNDSSHDDEGGIFHPSEYLALWFHMNMGEPGDYLPGLANLKTLIHGNDELDENDNWYSVNIWNAGFLINLLYLPKLKRIWIDRCGTCAHDGRELEIAAENIEGKSTVEDLNLWECSLRDRDFIELARYTKNLTVLNLRNQDYSGLIDDAASLVRAFRKHNRKLKLDKITVEGSTGVEAFVDAIADGRYRDDPKVTIVRSGDEGLDYHCRYDSDSYTDNNSDYEGDSDSVSSEPA